MTDPMTDPNDQKDDDKRIHYVRLKEWKEGRVIQLGEEDVSL